MSLSRTASGEVVPDATTRARRGPRPRGPVRRLERGDRHRPARPLPQAVAPRRAEGLQLRRDLLRQGRVVAAQQRLRARPRGGRRQADPLRADHRPLAGHPVDRGAPRRRQVADRAGREGVRDGPVRLAGLRGGGRLADDPGDVPLRPAGHRLHPARLRRRAAAQPRRPAPGAVAAGAARHLPGVLPALRRALPGRRPRLAAAPAGRDRRPRRHGARHRCPALGPGAATPLPALAGRRRRLLRARRGHEVGRALPPRGVRDPGVGLERRRPTVLRGAVAGAPLGAHRRRPGLRVTWSAWASSSTSSPGPAGWCTPGSTRSTAPRPSTRRTTAASSGRPPPSPTPTASARSSSRCGRSGTTTRTSTSSTPSS